MLGGGWGPGREEGWEQEKQQRRLAQGHLVPKSSVSLPFLSNSLLPSSLSGPPPLCLCKCVCVSFLLFLCHCFCAASPPTQASSPPAPLYLSLSLSVSVSHSLYPFSLQVGWRKKPTTDLNPATSPPVSSLSPGPGQSPPVLPFCILGGEALSPCGPILASTPQLPPAPPSLLPLAGFSPPTAPASLLSLFSVSVSLPPPPSIPVPPALSLGFFLLLLSPLTLADAISGSGQLSNISVGREKPRVSCSFSGQGCGRVVSAVLPQGAGQVSGALFSLAPAWESQNHGVLESTEVRTHQAMGLQNKDREKGRLRLGMAEEVLSCGG